MTNNDRNIRTLIVCFVVLLFVLVPLNFMEIQQSSVLGVSTENQIVLPDTGEAF